MRLTLTFSGAAYGTQRALEPALRGLRWNVLLGFRFVIQIGIDALMHLCNMPDIV